MSRWATHLKLVSFSCPHARLNDPPSDPRHGDRRQARLLLRMNMLAPAFALLLAGCSNVWVRPPGVDEAQFKQDAAACRAAAFYAPIAPERPSLAPTRPTRPTQARAGATSDAGT